MNVVRGLLVFAISAFAGWVFSQKYKKKTVFYNSFKDFNLRVKNEVSYSRNTILHVVNKVNVENDFNVCVKKFFNEKKFEFGKSYLSEDEKNFFNDYLNTIGLGDPKSQTEYLEKIHAIIDEKRKLAYEEEKKFKPLYLKLGILIGLMLFIVLL